MKYRCLYRKIIQGCPNLQHCRSPFFWSILPYVKLVFDGGLYNRILTFLCLTKRENSSKYNYTEPYLEASPQVCTPFFTSSRLPQYKNSVFFWLKVKYRKYFLTSPLNFSETRYKRRHELLPPPSSTHWRWYSCFEHRSQSPEILNLALCSIGGKGQMGTLPSPLSSFDPP